MRKHAFEDLRQERSSESTASLCRNPLRGWRKFAVVWLLALPLTLSAASRTVTATVNRDAGGVAESIELTFGECSADFRGYLGAGVTRISSCASFSFPTRRSVPSKTTMCKTDW